MKNFSANTKVIFLVGLMGFTLAAKAQSPDYIVPQFLQCPNDPQWQYYMCNLPDNLRPYLWFAWSGGAPGGYVFDSASMPNKNGYVLYNYRSTDQWHSQYQLQTTYSGITADINSPNWKVHPDGSADCTDPTGNCPFTNVPFLKKAK